MSTTRRYHFTHDGVWAHDEGHETARIVLRRRCDRHWWFRDPEVTGEAFRRFQFSFTVTALDQWRCHRRAMNLAGAVYMALSLSARLVPTPTWETLPPHTNRGRHRTPKESEPAPA